MPKRSKKSKTKRLTLKQKYKIQKKVREHHRKKRKEMKKLGIKPKEPKDPGIPAQWPFRDELVKEFAWKRQQILLQEKEKRDERKRAREEASGMQVEPGAEAQMAQLQHSAAQKAADFEQRKRSKLVSEGGGKADQDNSRRAFYKEFRRVVEASDVVIQVLDARDPEGCRCPDVERYVRSLDAKKKIILLLNKMDLVPREAGEAWLKYYREELPTVAFKSSTQHQARDLKQSKAAAGGAAGKGEGSACLGADTLLQLLKNYARNAGIKTSITVGVVGLPNVGKSSLINSLKRARVAQVGNTPGVTRGVQEVHLDKHIKLLDSPGIVFSSAENEAAAALRNVVKVERLSDPITPVGEVLRRVPAKQLQALYKVPAFKDVDTFLQHIAAARGKLKKGGVTDTTAAARIVLQDWNDGRIPFFTRPPQRANQEHDEAAVVASWAADFDADKVFANEASAVIAQLPSMEDAAGVGFFEAASAGQVAVQLEEMEADGAAAGTSQQQQGEDEEDLESMDEGYGAPSTSGRAGGGSSKAANALYGEEGQFNPHAARADRKRQKKAKKAAVTGVVGGGGDAEDEEGSDFDFDAANDGLEEAESGNPDSSGAEEEEGEGEDSDDEYGADSDDVDVDEKYVDDMDE